MPQSVDNIAPMLEEPSEQLGWLAYAAVCVGHS